MITFAEYKRAATSFGSSLDDRDDWLVSDISRTRGASILEESNFECAVEALGGESETVEIQRFGHWACGWLEHIFVAPSQCQALDALECALADYPVLDESDFSERECESVLPAWRDYGKREWLRMLCESLNIDRCSPVFYYLSDLDDDVTLSWHDSRGETSGLEHTSEGPSFNFRYVDSRYHYFADHITRDEIAAFIRTTRAAKKAV